MTVLDRREASLLVEEQGTDVVIPNKFTSFGADAFYDLGLTSVVIPKTITEIRDDAFRKNNLERITIPEGTTYIGFNSFYDNKLVDVEIPDSVEFIGGEAFAYNPTLNSIKIAKNAPFDSSVFPVGVDIKKRGENADVTPTPIPEPITPAPVPEPITPEIIPNQPNTFSVEKINSIDDIVTLKEVTTFELIDQMRVRNKKVEILIVGTKTKDKIIGSSEREVLVGGEGKDVLSGGDESDGFLFQHREGFGKKEADRITDFDADEGDSILVDKEVFDLGRKVKLKSVTGKKASKKASKSNQEFVYDDNNGLLYFNENGKAKGWGDDGGLFAKLIGAPALSASDFTIV